VHESAGNAAVPRIHPDGERADESVATPSGGEVRAENLAGPFGRKGPGRLAPEPRADVLCIAEDLQRVRRAEKGAESDPHHLIGLVHVLWLQRSYSNVLGCCPGCRLHGCGGHPRSPRRCVTALVLL
jgi:hypothetical protein